MIKDWATRTQRATQTTATRHCETWTTRDLEFVEAFASEPDAELAKVLGRTLFSIQTIKHAIRAGRVTESERRVRVGRVQNPAAYRGWREGDGDE